jgi:plastocyanin
MIKMITPLAICILSGSTAMAEDHTVTQVGLTYDPPSITVSPGDTITWVRTGGTHDAVHGDPCFEADSQGLFPGFPLFDIPLTSSSPSGTWTVPDAAPGRIPYFCSVANHCQAGMTGEIIVVPRAGSRTIVVEQNGLDFTPLEIDVSPGDTVVWNQNNGGHSVHTATDLDTCTQDNLFIALPLDFTYTQVVWEVPENIPTKLDYFCIYHCELGHVGTINRIEQCAAIDLNCDGVINGADLASILGDWGCVSTGTPCSGDVNDDGVVDGVDLAEILGGWTG